VYLETAAAWYILAYPSKDYKPFFRSFALQHATFHAFLTANARGDHNFSSFEEFVDRTNVENPWYNFSPEETGSQEVVSECVFHRYDPNSK
jgi:hypothetical protein